LLQTIQTVESYGMHAIRLGQRRRLKYLKKGMRASSRGQLFLLQAFIARRSARGLFKKL